MEWINLDSIEQLDEISRVSNEHNVLIFKHSIRCSISSMMLNRLERSFKNTDIEGARLYLLDLVRHRDISDEVARRFSVNHQSPQVLIIKDGKSIKDMSHLGITYNHIITELQSE